MNYWGEKQVVIFFSSKILRTVISCMMRILPLSWVVQLPPYCGSYHLMSFSMSINIKEMWFTEISLYSHFLASPGWQTNIQDYIELEIRWASKKLLFNRWGNTGNQCKAPNSEQQYVQILLLNWRALYPHQIPLQTI